MEVIGENCGRVGIILHQYRIKVTFKTSFQAFGSHFSRILQMPFEFTLSHDYRRKESNFSIFQIQKKPDSKRGHEITQQCILEKFLLTK